MMQLGVDKRDQSVSSLSSARRGELYEFLSYLFTRNPDSKFIGHLGSNEQIDRLRDFGALLAEESSTEELIGSLEKLATIARSFRDIDEKSATMLQEDYVRLLRGIKKGYGPPPPYESVYRSESMMSEHASDVRALYHRAGLEAREGEPPDHIGFELGFMAYLCWKEEEHVKAGDLERANVFISFQVDFLSRHILEWIPRFCRNLLNYDSAFYAAAAELTLNWLQFEKNNVNA